MCVCACVCTSVDLGATLSSHHGPGRGFVLRRRVAIKNPLEIGILVPWEVFAHMLKNSSEGSVCVHCVCVCVWGGAFVEVCVPLHNDAVDLARRLCVPS